jgi:hypothetical protein
LSIVGLIGINYGAGIQEVQDASKAHQI